MPQLISKGTNSYSEVIIVTDARFVWGDWGVMGEDGRYGQGFFEEALEAFDKVSILARMSYSKHPPRKDRTLSSTFSWYPLPNFRREIGLVLNLAKILRKLWKYSATGGQFVLRLPSIVGTLLWPFLAIRRKSYGVELIGYAGEALRTSGGGLLRLLATPLDMITKTQCKKAAIISYVSSHRMPRLYSSQGEQFIAAGIRMRESSLAAPRNIVRRPKRLKIIHIGTMCSLYKGQELLLDALKDLLRRGLDCTSTFVGDGTYRPIFQQRAEKLGIAGKVRFTGRVAGGLPILSLLDCHDLLVVNSLTEGLPNVIIEGLMRGIPIVATNVGGIPELIDKDYLVSPANPCAIADKIWEVSQDPSKLYYMSKRNIEKAKQYLPEKLRNKRVCFYQSLKKSLVTGN